jgi:hypothetical protein
MRSVRRMCLAGAAVLALLALVGSSSASADAVCKVNEAPCAAANAFAVGTTLQSRIKTGTSVSFKAGFEVKCTASTWAGNLTYNPNPGKGSAALVRPTGETFGGCTSSTLGTCSLSATGFWAGDPKLFANAESPGNGFTSGTTPEARQVVVSCAGVSCKWANTETITHVYKGGLPATENWKVRFLKTGGPAGCGTEMISTGEREFTGPEGKIFWTYG